MTDPVASGEYQPGSAVDVVLSLLTALERSSPADPGYGEIQYRQEVVAKAKSWLRSVNATARSEGGR